MTLSSPRLALIASLVPEGSHVIDVGADHGYLAGHLDALATERMPHRAGRGSTRWVIADGLRPFRHVDAAVIAGMGADTIARIVGEVPRPAVLILHAQDDPPRLRRWLAANGWRIDAEGLAPEARGFAEVLRATPGQEPTTSLTLEYGPKLLEGGPLVLDHLGARHRFWRHVQAVAPHDGARHERARQHLGFLEQQILRLEPGP